MGCPGPVNEEGVLLDAPNLGWENVKLGSVLEKEFGCKVELLNDVDAGVYGEYTFGAAKKSHTVIGIFPGTGVGGGGVMGGQVIRGPHMSCMEVGHTPVDPNGPLCGCGNRGCLEALSSRLAIAAASAQAAYRGLAPNLLEEVGTDISKIKSGVLARSIKNGDKTIEKIVRRAAKHIGTVAAGITNLLGADTIVLGGGLVEAMPELFTEEVFKEANSRVYSPFKDTFEVVAAELGDDSSVLGAAAWVQYCIDRHSSV